MHTNDKLIYELFFRFLSCVRTELFIHATVKNISASFLKIFFPLLFRFFSLEFRTKKYKLLDTCQRTWLPACIQMNRGKH